MRTVTASAPGRVEIIGNHTDYNGGAVILATVDLVTRVRGWKRGDGLVSLCTSTLGEKNVFPAGSAAAGRNHRGAASWSDYPRGVISVLAGQGIRIGGLEAEVSSTIPLGVGLSSSAALELAFCLFLQGLFRFPLTRIEAVQYCRKAENEYVGVACGILDQFACAFGRKNSFIFLDCRDLSSEILPVGDDFAILVCDSGIRRRLRDGDYNLRRNECREAEIMLGEGVKPAALRDFSSASFEKAAARIGRNRVMARAEHVIRENERVFSAREMLRRGDIAGLGELMFASHVSSRDLFENSVHELDFLVETARGLPGVLGARLCGAGWGGATVNLVRKDRVRAVGAGIRESYRKQFGRDAPVYRCGIPDGAAIERLVE